MPWDRTLNLALTLLSYHSEQTASPRYTVTFVNPDGTLLHTQMAYEGETANYENMPCKAYDAQAHYELVGWDKALSNITADTVITAQFDSVPHNLSFR